MFTTNQKMVSAFRRRALLLAACLLASFGAAAQQKDVVMPAGSTTIEEAIREVSSRTGYRFAVNTRFDRSRAVTFSGDPLTVTELLDVMVRDTGYVYEIRGQYIMIKADTEKEVPIRRLETPDADAYGPKIYYFVIDKTMLMRDYSTNRRMLDNLDKLLRDPDVYSRIDSVIVTSAASPIASSAHNERLSIGRAEAVGGYIRWQHPQVDRDRIHPIPIGIDWEGFWSMIENTPGVPSRAAILSLKGRYDEETTLRMLRTVGGKTTYDYLLKKIYPKLQYAAVRVVLTDGTSIPASGSPIRRIIEPEVRYDTVYIERVIRDTVVIAPPVVAPVVVEVPAAKKPFYIALKNNLVYDLALLPNLAVEIPFGRDYRWSAEVEGHWSWWNTGEGSSRSWWYHRIQMAGLEFRYWLGDRSKRDPLTGWYIGAYGFGGTYDVRMFTSENPDLGQLSNLSYSAGLSVGYSVPVARRLNLEFGLGFGYFGGEYKKYYRSACGDEFPWVSTHERNWFGPTKAKVSLVWQIGSGVNSKYEQRRKERKEK